MYLKEAQLNQALAQNLGAALVQDQGVALRIRCVANPESTPNTGDAVLVSATSLTLKINGAADTTVGASGVLAFATYTTLGALEDAINASGNWQAQIVGGLRSDSISSSQLLARSTSTFRMFQEISLKWDSSVHLGLEVALEAGLPFANLIPGLLEQRLKHRVKFQRAVVKNDNSGDALTLNVYQVEKDGTTTTLATYAAADATEYDTGVDAPMISADFGKKILVRFSGASTFSDTTCYVRVWGVRE